MVDKAADRGCTSDNIKFDCPTHPFLIYAIDTDEQLSHHVWSNKVRKHARETTGTHTRDRLQCTGTPSNTMCVRAGDGQLMLREVLASDSVTEKETRNLLQCRGTTYPTAMIVCRNKHGATDATCQLCKQAEETISHMLMHCPETEGVRHRAHDSLRG
eukprot:721921-Rhodomonas_salina.2